VKGRSVLYVLQRVDVDESKWTHFEYLVLIFVVLRLLSLFFLYFPLSRLWSTVKPFCTLLGRKTTHSEIHNINRHPAVRGSFRLSVLHLKSDVRPFDDISVSGRGAGVCMRWRVELTAVRIRLF